MKGNSITSTFYDLIIEQLLTGFYLTIDDIKATDNDTMLIKAIDTEIEVLKNFHIVVTMRSVDSDIKFLFETLEEAITVINGRIRAIKSKIVNH